MRLECRPAVQTPAGNRVLLDVTDAALVLALGAPDTAQSSCCRQRSSFICRPTTVGRRYRPPRAAAPPSRIRAAGRRALVMEQDHLVDMLNRLKLTAIRSTA